MNNDNHLIFEGYRQKRHLTPKESLRRDKEFFNYVIESNDHLSSLKKFSTKKLFSSYASTLANRINLDNPGLIKESNMSDAEAFGILNEATQSVSDQEAYDAVKDIFEEIAVKQLIRKADLFLEANGDPNELVNRPMARRPGQRDARGRMLPGQGAAQVQNQAQRDRVAGKMRNLRAANQTAAARIAELEARIQEMEAAEANMNQLQKSQSDAIQNQLAAMIKQIQTNNTAQSSGNQITGPVDPVIDVEDISDAPQSASTPAAAAPEKTSENPTQEKPGVMSKIGAGIKKYLPALGTIGGAALGSTLGPAGTAVGGALGRGLGRFLSPTDPKASLGKRLKDAGKSALAGGALGLGGQIGGEIAGEMGKEMVRKGGEIGGEMLGKGGEMLGKGLEMLRKGGKNLKP